MEIEKIDSNFAAAQLTSEGEKSVYTLPCAPFDLYGVYFDENAFYFIPLCRITYADGESRTYNFISGELYAS